MLDDDDIDRLSQMANLLDRRFRLRRPHPANRFVQQQERRPGCQRDADLQQGDIAVRQGARRQIAQSFEPGLLQYFIDAFGRPAESASVREGMHYALSRLRRDPQILRHCHGIEHTFYLQRPAHSETADPVRRHPRNIGAAKPYRPGIRFEHPGNRIEQGGLASPVRADDRVQHVRFEVERDMIQRHQPAEAFGQVGDLQHRRVHGPASPLTGTVAVSIASRGPSSFFIPSADREARRSSSAFQMPINPFGAKITVRMTTTPTRMG